VNMARVLVLGGTKFLGRAITEAALAGGHDVTLFNRGVTNPELFPGAEHLRGDRTSDLSALEGREWDAVIDVAAYLPEVAQFSAKALHDRVGQYVFVSTVSVYAEHDRPEDQLEEAAVLQILDAKDEGDLYGARKAACEAIVREFYGDRAAIGRPGLIVGPHDPTDRFDYWPRRLAIGGTVLGPGSPNDPVQFIDVRDLAAWLVDAAVDRFAGVFNLVGAPMRFADLIDACRVPGVDAQVAWVKSDLLVQAGVEEWMGIPLWIASDGWRAANRVDASRAIAAGLQTRPVAETVKASRANPSHESSQAISLEREQQLLQQFRLKPSGAV
jgi:nucleoside-diphosphate-sugar epimerase